MHMHHWHSALAELLCLICMLLVVESRLLPTTMSPDVLTVQSKAKVTDIIIGPDAKVAFSVGKSLQTNLETAPILRWLREERRNLLLVYGNRCTDGQGGSFEGTSDSYLLCKHTKRRTCPGDHVQRWYSRHLEAYTHLAAPRLCYLV